MKCGTACVRRLLQATSLCWFNLALQVWGKTGSKLYGPDSGADYVDNHKRFSMFCKAAVEAARVRKAACSMSWYCSVHIMTNIVQMRTPQAQHTEAQAQ